MTLNDLFQRIMNYNLENIGKDFIIPMIPVIFVIVIVPTLIIIIFFVLFSIYEKFFSKKSSVTQDNSHISNFNNNDWVSVSNKKDLYCYVCTAKLNLESWKNSEKFFCNLCYEKIRRNKIKI